MCGKWQGKMLVKKYNGSINAHVNNRKKVKLLWQLNVLHDEREEIDLKAIGEVCCC